MDVPRYGVSIYILFNFLVLMPMTGHGFFASKAGGTLFIANIILNYIWGVIASAWFRLCSY